jgi:inner membrane protein involved in colicin E2 resistance
MANPFPDVPSNISNIVDLVLHASNLVNTNATIGGFFGTGILIAIAVSSFLVSKAFSSEKSLAFSGFLTLLCTILFRFLNLINDAVLYIVVILFTASFLWLWASRQQDVGA